MRAGKKERPTKDCGWKVSVTACSEGDGEGGQGLGASDDDWVTRHKVLQRPNADNEINMVASDQEHENPSFLTQ